MIYCRIIKQPNGCLIVTQCRIIFQEKIVIQIILLIPDFYHNLPLLKFTRSSLSYYYPRSRSSSSLFLSPSSNPMWWPCHCYVFTHKETIPQSLRIPLLIYAPMLLKKQLRKYPLSHEVLIDFMSRRIVCLNVRLFSRPCTI